MLFNFKAKKTQGHNHYNCTDKHQSKRQLNVATENIPQELTVLRSKPATHSQFKHRHNKLLQIDNRCKQRIIVYQVRKSQRNGDLPQKSHRTYQYHTA
ncbi:hypothetical protein ACOMHN_041472 [Nucella lapillus]